jgi:ubiquinone/menaquinone biosynthesis C-methylase UbiE
MLRAPSQGATLTDSRYSAEPEDPGEFTRERDRLYTRFAGLYAGALRIFPVWTRWIERAIPHVAGPRVLEISFGTGHLLARYAGRFTTHGIDYNRRMVEVARKRLGRADVKASLVQASVENLPYPDESFDSIVNTMAFPGYPDGVAALSEMRRVLRSGGRLVLIDVNYPSDGNWLGTKLAEFWKSAGDVLRDMERLFDRLAFEYMHEEIGGWGSVHLLVARKQTLPESPGDRPGERTAP